jgi:hypothetical protein
LLKSIPDLLTVCEHVPSFEAERRTITAFVVDAQGGITDPVKQGGYALKVTLFIRI